MKKVLLIAFFLILFIEYGTAQFIYKYGLNIGMSYSNQLWNYKLISIGNQDKYYKSGLSIFLSAEKKINRIFSIRPEIGYIQKGFKNNLDIIIIDGTSRKVYKQNVILHDFCTNIGLKITPFKKTWTPYAIIGLRGDYMFSYKDVIIIEQASGLIFNMYKNDIDKFNKANLGGLICIGLEYKNSTYFEIEFNPTITNSFNSAELEIRDICWGIKIGLNINKLIIKKSTNAQQSI